MSNPSFADQLRSAPPWMIISVAAIIVGCVIMALPLVGFFMIRRQTAPARKAERAGREYWAQWIETGEVVDLGTKKDKGKDGKDPEPSEPEPKRADRIEEPTQPIEPEPEEIPTQLGEVEQPSWAVSRTQEWDVAEIIDAEIVETETEDERLFRANPLDSWVLPPQEDEPEYLPEADRTFRDLVARNWLTGEGADLSAEWEPWYATEESYA
jgi:hypothetical protein